jgi:DNA polymerase-3 subunit delta'
MLWPDNEQSLAWMQASGVPAAQAAALLRAAGGRPDDAVLLARSGRDARAWGAFPKSIAQGDGGGFKDFTPAQVIDVMHKLCHDLLAVKAGAKPRFFDTADLPAGSVTGPKAASFAALGHWSRQLSDATRTMEHPFNAGLMLEALVSQAKNTLNSGH